MKPLQNDEARANNVQEQMGQPYSIERNCKEQSLNHAQITGVRRQRSVAILESLNKWMKEQYMQVTPKSAIGKALAYSIERWERLSLMHKTGC